jgi:tellurite resistance protein
VTVYTDEESRTLRTAVFGAMVLVSTAEPGALDEESHAGIRAMATFSPHLRHLLGAARPELPTGTTTDVENGVLEALQNSMAILATKAPQEANAFPTAVLAICNEIAAADGQVGQAEHEVVTKIHAALTAS